MGNRTGLSKRLGGKGRSGVYSAGLGFKAKQPLIARSRLDSGQLGPGVAGAGPVVMARPWCSVEQKRFHGTLTSDKVTL